MKIKLEYKTYLIINVSLGIIAFIIVNKGMKLLVIVLANNK